MMIKKNKSFRCSRLTLIEMLVAMTALMLIMSYLINLIAKVNQLAVVQRSQTDLYEKQRLFFDIVGRDLQGMVASDAQGAEITYGFSPTVIAFVTSSGLGIQPGNTAVLQETVYEFNSADSTIYRYFTTSDDGVAYDFLGDTDVTNWSGSVGDSSVLLAGVEGLTFAAFTTDGTPITLGGGHDTAVPAYVDMQLLLSNPGRGIADTFERRIFLKRGY